MSAEFIAVMRAAGLEPPDHVEPGVFYRFPGAGKNSRNRAGWCKLFGDGHGGVFGDWSTDFSEHWQARPEQPLSKSENAALTRQIAEGGKQAESEREERRTNAAAKAAKIWESAVPAPEDHQYLKAKSINAHGLRVSDGALVVPLRDVGGNLHSLQFIAPDGVKRYLSGGAITGNYWALGALTQEAPYLYLAEGAATAAAVHEAIGGCVVAAMSAGNLKPVAEALHARYPGARIVVCADDDNAVDGNPGIKAATQAANAVNGVVAIPQFPEPRDAKATDWCDLALMSGREAVQRQIDDLLAVIDSFEAPPEIPETARSKAADDAAIKKLAQLSVIEYERQRKKAADELSVRATVLDRLVAEERERTAVDSGTDGGVIEELQPWGSVVDGRELANKIACAVARHVALPPGACSAVTLFIVGGYCMDAWRLWPKLLITSPERRCGKSTPLEMIEATSFRSLLTASITASALFRCIEEWRPTLLIDEADWFARDNDELNGIINAGHTKRTAVVVRTEKEADGFKPKKFSVWCPQVIVGIKDQRDTLSTVRMGNTTQKGYKRSSFADAWHRYLPDRPLQNVTTSQRNKLNSLSQNQNVTPSDNVTFENPTK